MGRRGRVFVNRFEDGSRQSVGHSYVETAANNIDRACAKEAAMFVENITVDQVIPMLFSDDHVSRLRAAYGLVNSPAERTTVNLEPMARGTLTMDFEQVKMCPPTSGILHIQVERWEKLVQATRQLNELHMKWGAVKHLLRWFNNNATPGAIRAIWPAVMKLCPDAPSLQEYKMAPPTRYANPDGISDLLPLIRDTSGTVAQMALIPDGAQVRIRETVWLTLPSRKASYMGTEIDLNAQTFFL